MDDAEREIRRPAGLKVIEFARDVVGGWLEAKGLELKWVGNGNR